MLHQPISQYPARSRSTSPQPADADRSMDALQYGAAFVAIIVAALLAVVPLTRRDGAPAA